MTHQVVPEAPGLGVLEVRVARHQRVGVLAGEPEQLPLQAEQVAEHLEQVVAQHQPLGGRLLIVAAPAGLEATGDVLAQAPLEEVLDLHQVRSRARVPREAAGPHRLDLQEPRQQAPAPGAVENARLDQHHHVGEIDGRVPAGPPLDLQEVGALVVLDEDGVPRPQTGLLEKQVLLRHGCLLTDRPAGAGTAAAGPRGLEETWRGGTLRR